MLTRRATAGKQVRQDGIVWKAFLALLLLLCAFPAFAQTFPPLTGRVVDQAGIFTPEERARFAAKLTAIEQSTGRQVVVATIANSEGYDLADYGYRLGRAWGIGTKGKNNGLVLFAFPNNPAGQRGPRIEVGYGLEPIITDAFASVVTMQVMTPMLKDGQVGAAFDRGIDLIGEQLKLTPEEAAKRAAELQAAGRERERSVNPGAFLFWIAIFFFVLLPMIGALSRGGRRRRHSSGLGEAILWTAVNAAVSAATDSDSDHWGGGGGGGWGGGGGGGGFSGGGGSFGGGGASGGW